jgi:hypothetical protein
MKLAVDRKVSLRRKSIPLRHCWIANGTSTGLGAGIDKDRPDYIIYSGGWAVGRIYETRGGPDHLRWFWSMTVTCPMTRSDRVATSLAGSMSPVSEIVRSR